MRLTWRTRARRRVNESGSGGRIDDAYSSANLPIIRPGLSQAGLRFASVLNEAISEKCRQLDLHVIHEDSAQRTRSL
jgi:hypothetical protein